MRNYRPIAAISPDPNTTVCRPPPPGKVEMDSPALEAMTDLSKVYVAVIEPHTSIEQANQYMILRGVRLLLVLNSDKSLAGIVTSVDIQGEKPLRFAQERKVRHSEILVSDIMTPLDRVEAISMDDIRAAKVGHIIATLRGTGRQHALLIERRDDNGMMVRGIFSLSQIARQLGITIQTTEVAKTFAEIEAMFMANSALG